MVEVGKCYLIRGVTMASVGRVVAIGDKFIALEEGSWVADTGRFSECLKNGTFSEVEVVPDGVIYVSIGAIMDIFNWNHALPKVTK